MNSRERVFAVLEGRPADRPPLMPITMMFAADRIGAPYGRYALDHRILVEAQLRTAEEFDFDHVSAITETREAPDCGAAIQYFEDQPYAIDEKHARLADKGTLARMEVPDPLSSRHMSDRLEAIAQLKRRAGSEKIVEGWVEGPCGASADLRGINTLMLDFHDDPQFIRGLFDFVLEVALRFGRLEVEAGADVIGMGDPAASLVGPRLYNDFVLPYETKLAQGLQAAGARVRLHICGNTRRILEGMGATGADIIDIDSAVPLEEARRKAGPCPALLGNIDPVRVLRDGSPESVMEALGSCHAQAGAAYIIGAGCEVVRETPLENIRAMAGYSRRAADALPAG